MKIYPPCNAFMDAVYLLQPYPKYLNGKSHTGVDIYGQARHRPQATEPGKVSEIVFGNPKSVGRIVIDGEATGTKIYYKHVLSALKVGDSVKAGDILGKYDDSGVAAGWWAGYHLHFEVHHADEGKDRDPVLYLLQLMPKIKWYMRDPVLEVYQTKEYFGAMNICARPF